MQRGLAVEQNQVAGLKVALHLRQQQEVTNPWQSDCIQSALGIIGYRSQSAAAVNGIARASEAMQSALETMHRAPSGHGAASRFTHIVA